MTTAVTEWHFAATEWARANLLREGVPPAAVVVTGNPVVDALRWAVAKLDGDGFREPTDGLRRILVTAHRRESFGEPFLEICRGLRDVADRNPDVELCYPVHLNPNVQEPVSRILGGHARIRLLPPVGYREMVSLLRGCHLVLTDSGGIQEEAPSLGKPCLVMRETTERPEGVEAGTARLVGASRDRIVEETERLLHDARAYEQMARAHNPYGDGRAGARIADILAAVHGEESRSAAGARMGGARA